MVLQKEDFIEVADYADLEAKGSITGRANGHTLALFKYGESIYAIDNRCPHLGFPLDKGTLHDGILTCHWHHARFDLASGGTFDLWTDDVDAFPTEVRDGKIYVDLTQRGDVVEQQRTRLHEGLEQNIPLVIGKAVIRLLKQGEGAVTPFGVGLDFGTRYRWQGWGRGLTTHTCTMNLIAFLDEEDHPRALYHGLSDIALETTGSAPRFCIRPLPTTETDVPTLKRWFRQFVEVRDRDGAERCVISAIQAGADDEQLADMLFAAATDHRYLDAGHTLDFINKSFEALDIAGWEYAEWVLTSMVPNLTDAQRMEESNAWRAPIDLVVILEDIFEKLADAVAQGQDKRGTQPDFDALVEVLLGDDPQAIVDTLLDALREGVTEADLAGVVAYTAARRIAHFHTSNEFPDWDTALHTFTFANGVHMGLRRVNSPDLLRGVFDAAMSIYLDRFLNIPSVKLPQANGTVANPEALLEEYVDLLNHQQQVNQAGQLVAKYLYGGGDPDKLMARMGRLLLREDRNFHTTQCVEAAFRQYTLLKGTPQANHVLIAAARYLAAHAPTMRAQGQTFQIATRLLRGENIFEEE